MSEGRGGSVGHIHPVTDAIYAALVEPPQDGPLPRDREQSTTRRDTPEGRKRLAAAMRAFWEKNRAVPLVERWYRDLRDDSAGVGPLDRGDRRADLGHGVAPGSPASAA